MKLLQKFCLFSVIFLFAFLLFWIIQQTNAVPPYCGDYHPTRTKIRNVVIDNSITWYNIVISNWITIIIEEAQSPIRDVWWDINVYLIPDYFDNDDFIDKCSWWECSTPTDTPNVDLWQVKPNDNFDFEKYKIWTISSGKFQDEVDFHEVRSWHDSFCARSSIMTQIITYHYKIEQIWNNYELNLVKVETRENTIRLLWQYVNEFLDKSLNGVDEFLGVISKYRTVIVGTILAFLPLLIFLFFWIKHLHKNDKLKNKKLRLTLWSLWIIILNFICVIWFSLMKIRLFVAVFALVANIMLFKYTLFIKWKYAILLGIFCSIILILGLLWLFLW